PLATPALGVNSSVDHAARCPEERRLQHAKPSERVVCGYPHLIAQLLGIERPALGVGGEAATSLANERERGKLQHLRQLEVMTWLGFVIHECRQLPARPFAGIAQIEVARPGARAIERWYLVVPSGRTGFRVGRNATDLHRRLRQDAEVL